MDPLADFGPNAADHLRRTNSFTNAPDILVNSFYDPHADEGAAFEELIGFHGGMGGNQTRPFLLFPAGFELPDEPIVGAATVHHLFKGWMAAMTDGTRARSLDGPREAFLRPRSRGLHSTRRELTACMEVTWVGHATALLDIDGYRVITDPLMTSRVAHLRRRRPLPSPDFYDVDLILLSHVHVDHLHLRSLQRLRPTAKVLTPRGSARLLRKVGFTDVTEIVVGDRIETGQIDSGPITVEVVPAAHKRGRGPHSRVSADPVGFVVNGAGRRVDFPGDTDLFDGMADLGDIDVALLPIWGWGSTLGEGHLNPERAAEATRIIRPELLLPIHWGTYAPEDGRRRLPTWFDQPPEDLRTELGAIDELHRLGLVEPGGTVTVPSR